MTIAALLVGTYITVVVLANVNNFEFSTTRYFKKFENLIDDNEK